MLQEFKSCKVNKTYALTLCIKEVMKDCMGVWLNIGILLLVITVGFNLKEITWLMNHIFMLGVYFSYIYSHSFKFDFHIAVYFLHILLNFSHSNCHFFSSFRNMQWSGPTVWSQFVPKKQYPDWKEMIFTSTLCDMDLNNWQNMF
jgi:hypothetical protein